VKTQGQNGVRARAARSAGAEDGFTLVLVVLLVALVLIALAVAAPVVAKDLERQREVEAEHRGEEYVRAIRLYYRKFHTYPPSMEALEGTNNVRFLRKRYIDPLTGKDDWRIIHVGENKTTVKGFFGQPLGGLNTTGAGGLGTASTLGTGFGGATTGTTGMTTIGSTSPLGAGFSGATIGTGSSGTGATGTSAAGSGTGSTDSTDSSTGGLGQIMGVGPAKTGPSIVDPNGQTTYETWEFIYDPKIELMYAKSNILGGGMASSSATGLGTNTGSGSTNSTNGTGSTTTSPGTNTPPASSSPFSSLSQ
jgi:type II secretory pathway pseudopilin PulG